MRLAIAVTMLLAACGGDDTAATDAGVDAEVVPGRALADRPDEVVGLQVHVMYVIPRDGIDRRLDVDGSIAGSVAAWDGWLAAQSGGERLRLDTAAGALDITFARLRSTDASIAAEGPLVRNRLEGELRAVGLLDDNKLTAVYYDGTSTFSCGGGAWPPALVGRIGALYLHGAPPGSPRCDTIALSTDGTTMAYLEFAMLHELVHTLGAVAICAPHEALNGHVGDSPSDLMYSGDQPWHPTTLDVDRDDYWGHGRGDCMDLSRSAFLEPLPLSPVFPPGW
jgi:hypothetical protein